MGTDEVKVVCFRPGFTDVPLLDRINENVVKD